MTKRIIKSHHDVTLTEVTQSDGKNIISRAYSVRAASNPTATKDFGDMGAADTRKHHALEAKLPTKDEARRIAANIGKLPEPLRRVGLA